ncbi:B3 domain-containing transcription factor VRN1-like [Solanum tuberosum]|nr:PREDICTED: B3 domain-containing transcription factor VRN1-like [Solanum tuberosum]
MLNPVFLEAPHGKAWEVEVENSQDQIWLAKGWKDFCGYYSISIRSLLVFTYNPRSHFDVAIYDHSKTEIEYPIDQEIESDEEEEDIPVLQANANVIEEDIPVNLQTNANVIEEEEEDLPVNLQTNANVIEQEISEGYEEHDQRNNPTLVPVNQEDGEANSRSGEVGPKNSSRYSFVNLNGDNPYFEMVIKKAHATYMTIPMRFAQSTDIINMKNMRLVNEEGVEWGVEIEYNRSMVIIKGGWTAFRKDNKIANGETCRFKLIRGHIANVLQVQKIPTPLSLQ